MAKADSRRARSTPSTEELLSPAVKARELEVSGMLLPAERRILVRADEPEPRRRFTIAHELGHWTCQCREGTAQPVYCRADDIGVDPETKALEREANIFAANLVMPELAVRGAWAELVDVESIAAEFAVSSSAIAWRLYNVGLLAEQPA
ncbi:MAG: ImmA/IrrE family metallo-endopeptidase [Actinobacteria bacterium]|nr:ImmA/IrrE family metallo-endopeptidase [Actinomycetota bacterium]